LVAVTEKLVGVPFVSPVTVQVVAPDVEHVFAPGEEVTVYPVMVLPPELDGGDQWTVAEPFPGTAVGPVGAVGLTAATPWAIAADVNAGKVPSPP
jgi:hypothetical protein